MTQCWLDFGILETKEKSQQDVSQQQDNTQQQERFQEKFSSDLTDDEDMNDTEWVVGKAPQHGMTKTDEPMFNDNYNEPTTFTTSDGRSMEDYERVGYKRPSVMQSVEQDSAFPPGPVTLADDQLLTLEDDSGEGGLGNEVNNFVFSRKSNTSLHYVRREKLKHGFAKGNDAKFSPKHVVKEKDQI